MAPPILATKLYHPPPRPKVVARPRLIERLNAGLTPGVILISAPAGFGKTTLISEWVNQKALGPFGRIKGDAGETLQPSAFTRSVQPSRAAWLSLDEADNDPARFLAYLVAAFQTIAPEVGASVWGVLQTPQPPPAESILTTLLNEIAALPEPFILVLDDFHVIEARPVDAVLNFLLEHRPPQLHLVVATREDPDLPLARLRARGRLAELRAADLRFTPAEAAEFLNTVMGLALSAADIAALEERTEGWIAGLQLAALSMQGHPDAAGFVQSFTGSHHFVLDYLVEEVLQRQPASVQTFLLRTSLLDRLCGPLCEALLEGGATPAVSGQATLERIERANLFIVPLDNERRWYRYHHLFADLLRQRLQQSLAAPAGAEAASQAIAGLHQRASQWFEDNSLDLEAFHHAVAAQDIARAARLVEEKGMPLHSRDALAPILNWLASLPPAVLAARPALSATHASLLLVAGQTIGVEEKLQAAEAALQAQPGTQPNEKTRLLTGQIAAARATLALTRYQVETMLVQSRRALEYLPPSNVVARSTALWTLGYAHFLQGERAAAGRAYAEAVALSQAAGKTFTLILATLGLGNVQEVDNQLQAAAETYRQILRLAGDQPQQIIHEAELGLARILYEWNDLAAAEHHGRQALSLARQYESVIDRYIVCEVFLARLKLAQGDVAGAAAILAQADQSARQQSFIHRIPEVAAAQVLTWLRQGHLPAARQLAETHSLSHGLARVHLAEGDAAAALAVLGPVRQQAEARGWHDERLRVLVLEALALQAHGARERAASTLGEALTLAESGGFVRLFVDEGAAMADLLARLNSARESESRQAYVHKLLAAFGKPGAVQASATGQPTMVEALSQRELDVLRLMAQGLSNNDICDRLFLALSTVKGHNQRIFDKLQVQRRTEAVARARDLGLL